MVDKQEKQLIVIGGYYCTNVIWKALEVHGVKLTGDAVAYLKSQGPTNFRKKYGDMYVAGVKLGGSLYADYSMTFSSKEEKFKLAAKVDAAYNGVIAGGGAGVSFETELNNSNVRYENSINVRVRGYAGDRPARFTSMKQIMDVYKGFDMRKGVPLAAALRLMRRSQVIWMPWRFGRLITRPCQYTPSG
jgi:hypothetical protein